jgi:putative DNA primase/helicase
MDAIDQFRQALMSAGLSPPDTLKADGKTHRFSSEDKPSHKNCWYFLHLDDIPWGEAGDWAVNGGDRVVHWCAKTNTQMSQTERDNHLLRIQAKQEQIESEQIERHQASASEAVQRFKLATVCTQNHYLTSKGVIPYGVKSEGNKLLIPMRDTSGALCSLQIIAPDGDKRFFFGGKVKGCYHSIGKPQGVLIVCEGYATGASIHEATGHAVAVAFNAGNLQPVAVALFSKYPALKIIIAADDDWKTEGNPGMTKALEAALAVGALISVPIFTADRPDAANDFNDLHHFTGLDAVKSSINNSTVATVAAVAVANAQVWPELQPLIAQIDQQDYPIDALPTLVRSAVQEVAEYVKAPIALVTTSALAALSVSTQAYVDVRRADKLNGPSGLFLLAIADSGERKSTCDSFFIQVVRDYEAQKFEEAKPFIAAYKSDFSIWETQRSGLLEKIKSQVKAGKTSREQENELHELDKHKPVAPRVPRLIYGDATPEALQYALAKEWPSGGVISSEAGSVFGSHGMGKESVMRNFAALNQLWDGSELKTERRSTESFTVKGARLTMALQAQEATIRAFLTTTNGLARGTGFLARFLVSWPKSTQGTRKFTEAPTNWSALNAFKNRLTFILNQPAPIDENGALTPVMLQMSPDAKVHWVAFHDAIESELSSGGELYEVRDVASKTADNAARLAALFHMFSGSIGPIGVEAIESGGRIAAWHLLEARRFLGELTMPSELANPARLELWLLDHCRRENTDKVTTRHILQYGPWGLREKAVLQKAIEVLEELGRTRVVKEGKKLFVQIRPELLQAEVS